MTLDPMLFDHLIRTAFQLESHSKFISCHLNTKEGPKVSCMSFRVKLSNLGRPLMVVASFSVCQFGHNEELF